MEKAKKKSQEVNQRGVKRPANTAIKFKEPSMTQQHLKDACNINKIMAKYEKTGLVTHINQRAAQYGDFSEVTDFQGALEKIAGANNMFMDLPAEIRQRFDNDPVYFVEFCSDPANIGELRELGLAEPEIVTEITQPAGSPNKTTETVDIEEKI